MPEEWTRQRLEQLQKLCEQGFSQQQIAEKLGITRNAVAGARYRYLDGLRLRDKRLCDHGGEPKTRRWTDDEIYRLRDLAGQGLGITAIAAMLHRTRGSVAGKARDYGISVKYKLNRQNPKPATTPRSQRQKDQRLKPGENLIERLQEGYFGQTGKVEIHELELRHCKFPIEQADGSTKYCGSDNGGKSSYCAHHHARVYRVEKDARLERLAVVA